MLMKDRGYRFIPLKHLIVQTAALLLIAALVLTQHLLCSMLDSQKAAAAWSNGGERFAQLSVFIEKGMGLTEESIHTLRRSVDSALTQSSISPAGEHARIWIDAYHAEGSLTFASQRASLAVQAIGIGGDFFHFHPFELHDGYYFSDSDTLYDRILIDETVAWQLFGSYDVTGLELKVGERPFIIAGVLKTENDFASSAALAEDAQPRIYMSYTALRELDEMIEICCYEAVIPDPVTGFAAQLLGDGITVDESSRIIAENSQRFRFSSLLKLVGSFGQRSMQKVAIQLPYWENAARMVEEYAALVQLLWLLLCLIPLTGIITLIVYLWRHRRFHVKDIPEIYDRIRTERYLRKQDKKLLKAVQKQQMEDVQDEKVEI